MTVWKPIDFEGLISLNQPLNDLLDQYLFEKEGQLGEQIVQAIHIVKGECQLPSKTLFRMKLSESLERSEKYIRQLALSKENRPDAKDFKETVTLLNKHLWHYVEILEGCVVELFQQLEQLGLEKWHSQLLLTINSIKILLMHRMEDLTWAIKRLEDLLWKYKEICEGTDKFLIPLKKRLPWYSLLDRNLITNLEKSKKYLAFRQKKFADRITDYNKFSLKINQSLNKFQNYHVFNSLDSNDQENFKQIYRLLKLWEYNKTSKSLPVKDIIRFIRHVQSEEKIYQVFNDYYQSLKNLLFHQARLFKLGPADLWQDKAGKSLAIEVLTGHRNEINALGATIQKYRDFLLRTDPNPYVRSRMGFTEWIVGQEPPGIKRLLNLSYDVESLDELYKKLIDSLENGPTKTEEERLRDADYEINRALHDMSQPLTSRSLMYSNVETIVNQLLELNELGSFNKGITDYFSQVLSKILRADWQYNAAFEVPKFTEIYKTHQGLIGTIDDRQHFNRKAKFKQIIQQIEDWSKKKITQRHVHEIEHDINDIKILLQDFLNSAQRNKPFAEAENYIKEDYKKKIAAQLLEYRYQFGHFFHQIELDDPDERLLKGQFLFVYQYFEAIEATLN